MPDTCTMVTWARCDGTHADLSAFLCKRWTCEVCMPIRARMLKQLAKRGKPERFITLTLPSTWAEHPDEGAQHLRTAWQRIVQRLKRRHGKDALEYLCVFEETKKGTPHLHILERGVYIERKMLKEIMREREKAPRVDIRKVKYRQGAACYIAKYISKAPQRYQGCKRYWTSQHWTLRQPAKERPAWMAHAEKRKYRLTLEDAASMLVGIGWEVQRSSKWHALLTCAWETAPPGDNRVTP